MTSQASAPSAIPLRHHDRLYIGGQWRRPSSDRLIIVTSSISEQPVAAVAEALDADIDMAVASARDAFDNGPWPKMAIAERAEWLRKLSVGLRERSLDFGHAWTSEVGVLYSLSAHVGKNAAFFSDYFADLASRYEIEEHIPSALPNCTAVVVREPLGVVAAIVPWNGPLILAILKIAPALVAGCTVVLKASPEAPLDAYLLAEVAEDIGLPPGVLNVVVAHREASEHLVRNPDVDKVSFTGSSAAGRRIASILGDRMARYTMELGGKSAAIILDDMDAEEAVDILTKDLCLLSGQVCVALTRVLVTKSKYKTFVDAFATAMAKLRVGDPYDPDSQLGPLATAEHLARVERYVQLGRDEGATLVVGGGRPKHLSRGHYLLPTLFANVDNRMTVAREEIFGPVLSLIAVEDENEAVQIANDSPYGLNAGVLTSDKARALALARRLRTGNFGHNGTLVDFTVGFGGIKLSGIGREGGLDGLRSYMETKTILLQN
jgi:betaine-aldehyde dehydrogenase